MSFLLRRRIHPLAQSPLSIRLRCGSGISISSDKSGLVFCATPCTSSSHQGQYQPPLRSRADSHTYRQVHADGGTQPWELKKQGRTTRSNRACLFSFGERLAFRSSASSIRLQDVPKMIRLSGKTGEVFCAASCTFSPTKVSIKLPSGRALTTIHIGKTTPTVAP